MADLINSSYFEKGDLYIPNNDEMNASVGLTVISDLDFYIEEYTRELLINALGIVLYEELQVALLNLQAYDQRWIDLVDGVTYTNPSGVAKRWEGLRGANKQSLVASFVYTKYLRNYNETFATTGVVRNDSKNATNYDATPKYIKAYNKFLGQYQADNLPNPITYVNRFGTNGLDWYGSESATVSLYQFLTDSNSEKSIFPDPEMPIPPLELIGGSPTMTAAILILTVSDLGEILTYQIMNPGADYTAGDVLTIPGGDENGTFTLDGTTVNDSAVLFAGTGYEVTSIVYEEPFPGFTFKFYDEQNSFGI
tara:strand:+ start:1169 stop:2095 length:927 start_codon:yes stop_codon:yes gene_type:complete